MPATPLDTTQPFTVAEGLAAGLSRRDLDGPAFRTVLRGTRVAATTRPAPLQRVLAALRLSPPEAWASHDSAGRVYDVPLDLGADEHVSLARQERRRRRAGIRAHVGDERWVHTVRGVRVSTPAQLFVEMAGSLGLVDLVVLGDHLVRRGRVSPESLRAFCARSRHRQARRARTAAAHVRAEVDSPMETRLRMLLVLAGLPEPVVNHQVRAEDGAVLRRFDLSYPQVRVLIEYDGRHHVERESQWRRDLARREANDREGWRSVVVVSEDVFVTPEDTLVRVIAGLRERGLPGVPARPSDQWRAHFPGRRRLR